MTSFNIRNDDRNGVVQENLRPAKMYRGKKENPSRAPLQCITNANCGKKRTRDCSFDNYNGSGIEDHKIDEKCYEIVRNENALVSRYNKKEDAASEDTILLREYGKDIWKYLYAQEEKLYWPKPTYILKQQQLTLAMRSTLIDWLVAVAHEYEMQEQTLYLCVNYIDRFLCTMSVTRDKFQLLGAAAMMLAIKVEEVTALDAEEWAHLTGQAYSSRQINRMEQLILNVLEFNLNPPTVIDFVKLICAKFRLDKKTLYLSMFLTELALLEGEGFLEYVPSKVAVASIVLSRYLLRRSNPYFLKLEISSGYKFEQIRPVILQQHRTFKDSPTKELRSIQNKYKMEQYQCVANVAPIRLNFEEQ
ncbi:hypothetical protein FQA39_LY11586 [Lamprigera yunnana]|nr:hypothetical protein FQA39_LY11586 [Lamprigera yunnana]